MTETQARAARPASDDGPTLSEGGALYERMARAIAFIDAHYAEHPTLATVAAAVGLSPDHFQRVFTQWAGVSPARLTRYCGFRAARTALQDGAPVLEAALAGGLSGPGRLHDAAVQFEAMTPGALRRAGAGETIAWGQAASPFGWALVFATARGICGLAFADEGGQDETAAEMKTRWPAAQFVRDDAQARACAQNLFAGIGPTPLAVRGTNFQIKVWEALLAIAPGQTVTYEAIARQVCSEKAARAVGAAVGANPVAWLIPCHRVLRKSGALGGYHWGMRRKQTMLAYEAVRLD